MVVLADVFVCAAGAWAYHTFALLSVRKFSNTGIVSDIAAGVYTGWQSQTETSCAGGGYSHGVEGI